MALRSLPSPIPHLRRFGWSFAVALAVAMMASAAPAQEPVAPSSQSVSGGFDCEFGGALRHARRLPAVAEGVQRRHAVSILAIGSSSTEGVGASSPDTSYPRRLEAALSARWPGASVSVTNAGVGGETATRTLERMRELVARHRYDLVVWQVGTNDALRGGDGAETFKAQLEDGIQTVRASGADLVMVDPQLFPGIKDPAGYRRFVETVSTVAGEEHVPVFSRYAMMTTWAARGSDALLAGLAPDRFHMNDTGYACLGRGLAGHIAGMVRMGPALAGR